MKRVDNLTRKDVAYHVSQEEINLIKFGQLWHNNRWGGITGSTEPLSSYDVHMTRMERKYVIELKDRDCQHDAYDTAYIEFDKYCDLLMQHVAYGYTPLYICFYNDGKARVFNILENLFPNKVQKHNARNKGWGDTRENGWCYELQCNKSYVYTIDGRTQ